jgi:hypothetical protein
MQTRKTGPLHQGDPEQTEILVCEDCGATAATDSTVRLRRTFVEEEAVVLCETCYENRADEW